MSTADSKQRINNNNYSSVLSFFKTNIPAALANNQLEKKDSNTRVDVSSSATLAQKTLNIANNKPLSISLLGNSNTNMNANVNANVSKVIPNTAILKEDIDLKNKEKVKGPEKNSDSLKFEEKKTNIQQANSFYNIKGSHGVDTVVFRSQKPKVFKKEQIDPDYHHHLIKTHQAEPFKPQQSESSKPQQPESFKSQQPTSIKPHQATTHSLTENPSHNTNIQKTYISTNSSNIDLEYPFHRPPIEGMIMKGKNPKRLENEEKPYKYADLIFWTNQEFEWSVKLMQMNQIYFNHPEFRPNQKAIINCTMAKKDVFVCMPTGGGKSLTFQLPALVDKGVTLVIMPLLALIYDQDIQMERKGIPVLNISGERSNVNFKELAWMFKRIKNREISSDKMPKLIYSTPEKIGKSPALMRFLKDLYDMDMLERIVIDEAHCVSQWGRDFRPDYLTLGKLKEEFPKCCTMALTATATEIVKIDIVKSLKMNECLYFQSSFNRKNLIYEVRKKSKGSINEIAEFILANYPNKAGIIYCNTIKDAEKVSNVLKLKYKLKCGFYHSKMKEDDRNNLQNKWMNDEVNVIIATLAFGMGINKLDVRYVIHYSFPKSISNYYQESGRAARDGYTSHCIIFYQYQDITSHYFLLFNNSISNGDTKKENVWELSNIVKYCEDKFNCRRVLQLGYLGEKFNREDCQMTCDNCHANRFPIVKNYTEEGIKIIEFLNERNKADLTIKQIIEILGGRIKDKNKRAFRNITQIGVLNHLRNDDIEAILKELIWKKILFLKCTIVYQKPVLYVDVNKYFARTLLSRECTLQITIDGGRNSVPLSKPASSIDNANANVIIIDDDKGNTAVNPSDNNASKVGEPRRRVYIKKPSVDVNDKLPKNESNALDANRRANNTSHGTNEANTKDSMSFFDSFTFNKPNKTHSNNVSPTNAGAANASKAKREFSEDYGYCTEDQFQEILERLKIVRKRINTEIKDTYKAKGLTYVENLENIFPLNGLHELCKRLPMTKEELTVNNIKNVSAIQLKDHGEKFLKEIEYFIGSCKIDKTEFYFPKSGSKDKTEAIFDITKHLQQAPKAEDTDEDQNPVDLIFEELNENEPPKGIDKDRAKPSHVKLNHDLASSLLKKDNNANSEWDFDINDYVPDNQIEKVIKEIISKEKITSHHHNIEVDKPNKKTEYIDLEQNEDLDIVLNNTNNVNKDIDELMEINYESSIDLDEIEKILQEANGKDNKAQNNPPNSNNESSTLNENNKRPLDENSKNSLIESGVALCKRFRL